MKTAPTTKTSGLDPAPDSRPGDPCIMVLFGCNGDLTKRLLMPAIYNLVCDGLLPEQFAIIGADRKDLTAEQFRANMSSKDDGIHKLNTRKDFNPKVWEW